MPKTYGEVSAESGLSWRHVEGSHWTLHAPDGELIGHVDRFPWKAVPWIGCSRRGMHSFYATCEEAKLALATRMAAVIAAEEMDTQP